MPDESPAIPVCGDITLRFLELCQFRRLGKVQLDVDKKTTILVGSEQQRENLSNFAALRHFLADGSPFLAFLTSAFTAANTASSWKGMGSVGGRPLDRDR